MNNDNRQSAEVLQAKQRLGIIGNAPALTAAVERTIRVAPIDLSVLVTGESGTGKEFFPKIIHAYSPRKHAKYIAVNCGAIPEGTIDSELFGHEKGSFTGAVASRKGYFEEADGGTIFLDEVAELPLTTQARLLRVLETGEFLKVGSSTVQKTNIRVVAATNVNMIKAVEEGRFREDLYYRLSTVQITIPPLRERGSDIALLTRKFAADFAERWRLPEISFTEEARNIMARYRWPGNVRQLKNIVEQIALFEAGRDIDTSILKPYLPENATVLAPAIVADRSHSYEHEREALFNLIFRLQSRIDELEQRVSPSSTIADEPEASSTAIVPRMPASPFPTREHKHADNFDTPFTSYQEEEPAPQAAPQPASPVMTMEEREREAIRDALARNGGRRKDAAEELKISQRTLYRKIKEYGLE
jgi:DNA-binding NtrC family response regulator